jgi:hypothetical protein
MWCLRRLTCIDLENALADDMCFGGDVPSTPELFSLIVSASHEIIVSDFSHVLSMGQRSQRTGLFCGGIVYGLCPGSTTWSIGHNGSVILEQCSRFKGPFQIVHVVYRIFAGHLPLAAAQITSSPSRIHGIPLLDGQNRRSSNNYRDWWTNTRNIFVRPHAY